MRFSLEKTELLTALSRVLIAEAAKNSLIGGLIRISIANRRLELAAAESAVYAITTLPIDVSGEAGLCVQNRRLQDALKVMPAAKIQVMITAQTPRLEAEGFRLDIGGVGLDHFAVLPPSPSGGQKVPSGVLRKILKRTAYAVMADMTHPVMAGVYLSFTDGAISAEATDGRRLARTVEQASISGTLRMLVNYKAVGKLLEVLDESSDVTLTEKGRHLFFCFPSNDSDRTEDGW